MKDLNGKTQFGFSAYCAAGLPVSTAISDSGDGVSKNCGGSLNVYRNGSSNFSTFGLEVSSGDTKGKLYTTNKNLAVKFLSGTQKFRVAPSKGSSFYATSGSSSAIGVGKVSESRPSTPLDDKTFIFPTEEKTLLEVGQRIQAKGHLKFGESGWGLSAGPSLYTGVGYDEKYSQYNKVRIELGLMLGIEYTPELSFEEKPAPTERKKPGKKKKKIEVTEPVIQHDTLAATQTLYNIFHSTLQRRLMGNTLSLPQDKLAEGGVFSGTSSTPDAMFNVPALTAISSFTSALAGDDLNYSSGWFWGHTAAKGIGGLISLTGESSVEKTGGVTELLLTGRRFLSAAYDIESPLSRKGRDDKDIESGLLKTNLISLGVYSAAMLLGVAGHSDTLMRAGVNANLSMALTPDPIGLKDYVQDTAISLIPWTSRGRAGISIDKSLKGNLYTHSRVVGRSFTGSNLKTTLDATENYTGTDPVASIGTSVGFEFKKGPARFRIGPDFAANFGGAADNVAAVGAYVSAALYIPIIKADPSTKKNEHGITFGVAGTGHVICPSGSFEKEAMVEIGIY